MGGRFARPRRGGPPAAPGGWQIMLIGIPSLGDLAVFVAVFLVAPAAILVGVFLLVRRQARRDRQR